MNNDILVTVSQNNTIHATLEMGHIVLLSLKHCELEVVTLLMPYFWSKEQGEEFCASLRRKLTLTFEWTFEGLSKVAVQILILIVPETTGF